MVKAMTWEADRLGCKSQLYDLGRQYNISELQFFHLQDKANSAHHRGCLMI